MSQQNKRPSAGDLTGRQKYTQQREQQAAAAERSAEMSMASAVQDEEELRGVFDPQSGDRVDTPPPSQVATVVETVPSQPGFTRTEGEPVLTGQEPPENPPPAVVVPKHTLTAMPPEVVRSATATIRLDTDVEDMTYGMRNGEPNNYNFKEGLAYKVPLAVAEHLNERGLVRQWISS